MRDYGLEPAAEIAVDGFEIMPVSQTLGLGATRSENRHQLQAGTDVAASLASTGS